MKRKLRLGINGYGRIGRCVLRAWRESPALQDMDIVLINEPSDLETVAYLTEYDSTHGRFPGRVGRKESALCIDGRDIPIFHTRTPDAVPWHEFKLDLLLECSGQYGNREALRGFIDSGCPRVLVSHPGQSAADVDRTIVYGINEGELNGGEQLVSAASCTTNAVVPVLALLDQSYGVEHAFLTTLHSVMNDQPMIDGYHHADLRRTRSAMQSMIPVSTGLAQGVERLLPALAGRVQAKAIRVPVLNVSAIDLMVQLRGAPDTAELNSRLVQAAQASPGLLAWTDAQRVSVDFNHDPHSAVIDGSQTRANGRGQANLLLWFDNEWGFANRMLDVARAWLSRSV